QLVQPEMRSVGIIVEYQLHPIIFKKPRCVGSHRGGTLPIEWNHGEVHALAKVPQILCDCIQHGEHVRVSKTASKEDDSPRCQKCPSKFSMQFPLMAWTILRSPAA